MFWNTEYAASQGLSTTELERLNAEFKQFHSLSERELDRPVARLRELLKLWLMPNSEEAKKVFGGLYTRHGGKTLMVTRTADTDQVRVWYGLPNRFSGDHVDSAGCNLLMFGEGKQDAKDFYTVITWAFPKAVLRKFTNSDGIEILILDNLTIH